MEHQDFTKIAGLEFVDQRIAARVMGATKLYGFKGNPFRYRLDQLNQVNEGHETTRCYMECGYEYLTLRRTQVFDQNGQPLSIHLEHLLTERDVLASDMRLMDDYTELSVHHASNLNKLETFSQYLSVLYPSGDEREKVCTSEKSSYVDGAQWFMSVYSKAKISGKNCYIGVQTGSVTLYDVDSVPRYKLTVKRIGFEYKTPFIVFLLEPLMANQIDAQG